MNQATAGVCSLSGLSPQKHRDAVKAPWLKFLHGSFEQFGGQQAAEPAVQIRPGLRIEPRTVGFCELADEGEDGDVGKRAE